MPPDRARRRLVIMVRQPRPGTAKTRLASAVGAAQAAGVYARLLYDLLLRVARAGPRSYRVTVAVASKDDVPYFSVAFPEFEVVAQAEGCLGTRLRSAFERSFAAGASEVVVAGSDVAGLDAALVATAFAMLESSPLVLGPAADGGYYLVGQQPPGADLFSDVDWGTSRVLEQTLAHAGRVGVPAKLLPELEDIDTIDDLSRWRATLLGRHGT